MVYYYLMTATQLKLRFLSWFIYKISPVFNKCLCFFIKCNWYLVVFSGMIYNFTKFEARLLGC